MSIHPDYLKMLQGLVPQAPPAPSPAEPPPMGPPQVRIFTAEIGAEELAALEDQMNEWFAAMPPRTLLANCAQIQTERRLTIIYTIRVPLAALVAGDDDGAQ
jgi:hypothetical protein